MTIERIETDVLCVGGGIAGLMAAVRARQFGTKVVVVDKGNTLTSGSGGAGNDHFVCYIPEVHGPSIKSFIEELMLGQMGPMCQIMGPSLVETWISKTFDIVKLWEEWGIPMKHEGEWKYSGHAFPGHMRFFLKYKGRNQKRVLTRKALEAGVDIINRAMVFEFLGDSQGVKGALAIDTREDRLIEILAKSVFLGTGRVTRLYPGISPAVMNNHSLPINLTGDGRAMLYRLGGEICNAGFLGSHVGLRNFARAGQGSWLGVYRGPDGKPLGHYVSQPNKDYGDIIPEVDKKLFARILESGRGPVYMDCSGVSDDHLAFMLQGLANEGNEAVINHLEEEGVDLGKTPIEFMTYPLTGGVGQAYIDDKMESSVKGLFLAGDEVLHSISVAAVLGWIAGGNAATHAKRISSVDIDDYKTLIDEKKNFIDSIQSRDRGYGWKDANVALQQVMLTYTTGVRSESMLEAGYRHLCRLKAKVDSSLVVRNRWELTRCMEVMNLYDLGEIVFLSALERRESRGEHQRADYPYTDPLLNGKLQVIKKVNGQPRVEWKIAAHAFQKELGV
jgi:succinate dehydrogenase/fumarate reductase flavoprotein subunit